MPMRRYIIQLEQDVAEGVNFTDDGIEYTVLHKGQPMWSYFVPFRSGPAAAKQRKAVALTQEDCAKQLIRRLKDPQTI